MRRYACVFMIIAVVSACFLARFLPQRRQQLELRRQREVDDSVRLATDEAELDEYCADICQQLECHTGRADRRARAGGGGGGRNSNNNKVYQVIGNMINKKRPEVGDICRCYDQHDTLCQVATTTTTIGNDHDYHGHGDDNEGD